MTTVYITGNNTFVGNSAQTGTGGGVSLYKSAVEIQPVLEVVECMWIQVVELVFMETVCSQITGLNNMEVACHFKEVRLCLKETQHFQTTAYYGGAIQAFEANINVTGNVDFAKNLATVNGGTLALAGGSVVYIF